MDLTHRILPMSAQFNQNCIQLLDVLRKAKTARKKKQHLSFYQRMHRYKFNSMSGNGALILYGDGTKRFVANSWYVDINTDQL